jgi:hypothetical protein
MESGGEALELLPNGGIAAALIAVVILFLRRQEKGDQALRENTDAFLGALAESRHEVQEQLRAIAERSAADRKETQALVRQILDDHLVVTREATAAMRQLQAICGAVAPNAPTPTERPTAGNLTSRPPA